MSLMRVILAIVLITPLCVCACVATFLLLLGYVFAMAFGALCKLAFGSSMGINKELTRAHTSLRQFVSKN